MIADISLALSILSLVLWILFAIAIRRVFNKLKPFFNSMSQNLMYSGVYGKMGEPAELSDVEIDK